MQTQPHIPAATSINKMRLQRLNICLHINSNGGYSWLSLCFSFSSPQGRLTRCKAKALQLMWCGCSFPLSSPQSHRSLNLDFLELSSSGATPARPEGVCLSIFFFVCSVWQVVARDTCSRINLQGLVVYEKHPLLWQGALCSWFTHRSKSFEPNSGCSLITSAQSFPEKEDYKAVTAPRGGPFIPAHPTYFQTSSFTSRPHQVTLSQSCNHALIVQRDAFFILAYEILKRLRNMCSAMQM